MTATILVVENHNILRGTLHAWLEFTFPECRIIEVLEEELALDLALLHLPDVIIVDIRPYYTEWINLVKQLKQLVPTSKIVVMTNYNDAVYRAQIMASGASAFVFKSTIITQLQPVLEDILGSDAIQEPKQEAPDNSGGFLAKL